MRFQLARLSLVAALILIEGQALAYAGPCSNADRLGAIERLSKLARDPVEQLQIWEVTENLEKYREATDAVSVEYSEIPAENFMTRELDRLPAPLREFFLRGGNVHWPKHPNNTSDLVPYRHKPSAGKFDAFFTASRSLFFRLANGSWFSLKMGTDFPHKKQKQPEKADLREDVNWSISDSEYIESMDRQLRPDPELVVLRELLSVQDKKSYNGFVVRDLSPLAKEGSYFLPGFAVPFVGGEIAKSNGQEFASFWQKHFAEAVGRSKAKLLLRYGSQMVTPNPQNMLIELTRADDGSLHPTGTVVWRDTVDSHLVGYVAKAIGQGAELEKPYMEKFVDLQLKPNTQNSLWRLEIGGTYPVTGETKAAWAQAHDRGYIDYVRGELGIEQPLEQMSDLHSWLSAPEGVQRLADYHQSLRADQGAQPRAG